MDERNNTMPPPPPAEVKVRTMRGDISSMAQTGGGLPQFQTLKIDGLTIERVAPTFIPTRQETKPAQPEPVAQTVVVPPSTPAAASSQPAAMPSSPSPSSSRTTEVAPADVEGPAVRDVIPAGMEEPSAPEAVQPSPEGSRSMMGVALVVVVALIAVAVVGYVAYLEFGGSSSGTPPTSAAPTQ